MAASNINIRTDSEIKNKAQEIFAMLGLDMTTAVNLFLRQTVRMNDIPFVITTYGNAKHTTVRPPFEYGSMSGKVWMADDFNAPLDAFGDYMA
ncbi:MAG: type II toxin-antitoxin system RelB/DinJ family antitoxin [Clostridia bacterium]|nr:type II toxin-antitoxin system RelB/DinJ family antitoxin [Clostridia bacterium]